MSGTNSPRSSQRLLTARLQATGLLKSRRGSASSQASKTSDKSPNSSPVPSRTESPVPPQAPMAAEEVFQSLGIIPEGIPKEDDVAYLLESAGKALRSVLKECHRSKVNSDNTKKLMVPVDELHRISCSLAVMCLQLHSALHATESKAANNDCKEALSRLAEEVTALKSAISKPASPSSVVAAPTQPSGVPPPVVPGRSYANAAGRPPAARVTAGMVTIEGRDTTGNPYPAEKVCEILTASVKPEDYNWKVVEVRKRSSKIRLKTSSVEEAEKMAANSALAAAGLKATVFKKKKPRVTIFDVPRAVGDTDLIKIIRTQNFPGNRAFLGEWASVSHYSGPKNDKEKRNVILNVTPDARDHLITAGRVYISWGFSKVLDFVGVTRCWGCHLYGHIKLRCPSKDTVTCSHCAEVGHVKKDCPKSRAAPVCVPCKAKNWDSNHAVESKKCPIYEQAFVRELELTQYNV